MSDEVFLLITECDASKARYVKVSRLPITVGNAPHADVKIHKANGRVRVCVTRDKDGHIAHNLVRSQPGKPARSLRLRHGTKVTTAGVQIQFFTHPVDLVRFKVERNRTGASMKSRVPVNEARRRRPKATPRKELPNPVERVPAARVNPLTPISTRPTRKPCTVRRKSPATVPTKPFLNPPRVYHCKAPKLLARTPREESPAESKSVTTSVVAAPPSENSRLLRDPTSTGIDRTICRANELVSQLDKLRDQVDSMP